MTSVMGVFWVTGCGGDEEFGVWDGGVDWRERECLDREGDWGVCWIFFSFSGAGGECLDRQGGGQGAEADSRERKGTWGLKFSCLG